ncbi:MAG: hypothetical protein WAX23_07835 [Methanosarcina sp.]
MRDKFSICFYVPLNFGAVIMGMNNKVARNGAKMPDWLFLSDHPP